MKVLNARLARWARRIDWVWRGLALMRRARHHAPHAPTDALAILVLDLHLIGDAVMLLPFLAALRRRYPQSFITVVAGPWNLPVLDGEPSIDRVIEFAAPWVKRQGLRKSCVAVMRLVRTLQAQRWDIGIDMRGDIRNILILYFANCVQRFGFDFTGGASLLTTVVPDNGQLASLLNHHERLAASLDAFDGRSFVALLTLSEAELSAANCIARYIGFHFGASMPLRRPPVEEAAALLAAGIGQFDERVVLFSAPDIEAYVAEVLAAVDPALRAHIDVWCGDLRGFIVVASRARVLYTMDSGPAHLAAATGCPTVVLFGPNRSAFTAPRGPNVICVELDPPLPCQPCDQHRCVHPSLPQACLRGQVPAAIEAGLRLAARADAPALGRVTLDGRPYASSFRLFRH